MCDTEDVQSLRPHLLQLRFLIRSEVARPARRHRGSHDVKELLRFVRGDGDVLEVGYFLCPRLYMYRCSFILIQSVCDT